MVAPTVAPAVPVRRRRVRRSVLRVRRRVLPAQSFLLLLLTALAVGVTFANVTAATIVPITAMILVMLLGAFFLRIRAMVVLYLVIAAGVFYSVVQRQDGNRVNTGSLAVIVLTAVIVLLFARSRERLGVQGTLGESMLVDLRDRLRAQGMIPLLMEQWHLEKVLKSAYGDSFSGDFLVATRSTTGPSLEMALVDVSGKGQSAGTRALLLSGAFGGLLGAMSREQFLPAANAYLLRQRWDEGFATAVHLAVDMESGRYRLASAGHPPSAHFHAGSGLWELLDGAHGPALGVLESDDFPAHDGRLERGDALLMYTDGLVETPGRDLGLGIDRLMGQAERVVQRGGFEGGASRIVDGTRSGENDDRALVLLWRE